MPEQRVSDKRVRKYADGGMVPSQDLALDLLDARALLAAVRPVVAASAAVAGTPHDRMNDGGSDCFNGCAACAADLALCAAVDALPADVREWAKE